MASFSGPEIVNNGLVLYLDASNQRSYPGSGTTWTDLSGQEKTGTLTNGVGYNSDLQGGLIFDRVNDYVQLSNSYTGNSLPTGSNSRTIICCFKTSATPSTAPYEHIIHYGSQAGDAAYGITLFNLNSQYWISNHTWAGTSYMSDYSVLPSTIYWVATVYNNNSTPRNNFFVNGKFGTVSFGQGKTADYSINTGTGNQLNIGTRVGPAEYFGGIVYFVQIYNRALAPAEVRQNFEATRDRYGI